MVHAGWTDVSSLTKTAKVSHLILHSGCWMGLSLKKKSHKPLTNYMVNLWQKCWQEKQHKSQNGSLFMVQPVSQLPVHAAFLFSPSRNRFFWSKCKFSRSHRKFWGGSARRTNPKQSLVNLSQGWHPRLSVLPSSPRDLHRTFATSHISGLQVVIAGQSITVSPHLHQKAAINFPISAQARPLHVGTSSFSAEMFVKDDETGDILIQASRLFTLMSRFTGRSQPVPEDIRWVHELPVFLLTNSCCETFFVSIPGRKWLTSSPMA